MLTFRNTSVAFLVLLAGFSLISIFSGTGYLLLLALAVTYLLLLVFGSVFVCSGFYLEAFCRYRTEDKVIALTFDDGPDPVITPLVLDLLKDHDIPAMFFVIGRKVGHNQQIMERIIREGHAAGNHSYSHAAWFDLWSSGQMNADLEKAEEIIALASGKRPTWFRPPFGVTNPTLAIAVSKKNYQVMGWSIRSLDTAIKDPEQIFRRIKKRWRPGGIILLHDTNMRTPVVLKMIIEYAQKTGYRFVRADRYQ